MGYTYLGDCENRIHSIPEFLRLNRNVIADPGVEGCTLYQVTEKQLILLKDYFKSSGIQFEVCTKGPGICAGLLIALRLRKWLTEPSLYPGRKEKEILIERITRVKETLSSVGIDPSDYDELLERLYKVPDTEDIVGYSLRYNY